MPNSKGQNPNGGSAQFARDPAKDAAHQVQQGAEQVAGRLQEGYDAAREQALHGYRQAEGLVARNPAPSLLLGFGAGFGLGLILCSLIKQSREETWAEKYLPGSLQDLPERYKGLVQEAPEKYKDLISSLKGLPKAIHDYLPHSIAKHLG